MPSSFRVEAVYLVISLCLKSISRIALRAAPCGHAHTALFSYHFVLT